jgi:hypothetical protein
MEKKKPLDVASGSSFGGGLFDGGGVFAASGGMAVVQSAVYREALPVVGMTIGQIRTLFADRLDVAPNARGVVGGSEVGDDHVVAQGETLEFVRRSGEKGRAWTCST